MYICRCILNTTFAQVVATFYMFKVKNDNWVVQYWTMDAARVTCVSLFTTCHVYIPTTTSILMGPSKFIKRDRIINL